MTDASSAVRLGALEAVLGLPLDAEGRRAVARYVVNVLADATRPERTDVIALAARVPSRSVRERLAELAIGGGSDALPAAISLAAIHDSRAVEPLLEAAERADTEAMEALASVDVSSVASRVHALLDATSSVAPPELSGTAERRRSLLYEAADAGLRRFWLALALARSGDEGPLRSFVEDHRDGRVELSLFWGQPEVGWAAIRAGGPVPAVLLELGYRGWDDV